MFLINYLQVAEKVKEFFHNEGIHSTTIQPEFVETGGGDPSNASITSADDCMLACPKVSERCQITFYFKTRNTKQLETPGFPIVLQQKNYIFYILCKFL